MNSESFFSQPILLILASSYLTETTGSMKSGNVTPWRYQFQPKRFSFRNWNTFTTMHYPASGICAPHLSNTDGRALNFISREQTNLGYSPTFAILKIGIVSVGGTQWGHRPIEEKGESGTRLNHWPLEWQTIKSLVNFSLEPLI